MTTQSCTMANRSMGPITLRARLPCAEIRFDRTCLTPQIEDAMRKQGVNERWLEREIAARQEIFRLPETD